MRVLITGITGLIGSHLAEYLTTMENVEVFGLKRWRSITSGIEHLAGSVKMLEGDVEDAYSIEAVLDRSQPDRIFHLAAQSYPSESWNAPEATFNTNVNGTIHLLQAARRIAPEAQVLIACSSAEYGSVTPDEIPIAEDHPLRPLSPYGVSKVAQELLGLQYHLCFGSRVYLARFFNQIGAHQADRCSIQTFARQIACIEREGDRGCVLHGNLAAERDFLDVRDGVRAVWLLLERGQPGKPYNVCSGQPRRIGAILDELIELSTATVEARFDPSRARPADEPILVGDHSRLSTDTGWQPEVPFSRTLRDILEHWRRVLTVGR